MRPLDRVGRGAWILRRRCPLLHEQLPRPASANRRTRRTETVSLEGALIEVPLVVADRSGHYVPQLRQQDFRILEDGVEQQITFFSDQRVPIHVAIVMDTSGSTRDTIGEIQQAAIEFISQLLPGDQVMIVSFAGEVIVEQEFTSDRRALSQAILRTQANGSTKLYEAVYLTVAERLRQVDGRKAMIILSDGEDTASKDVTFDEAVNVCSESDVVAYGIRYPESSGMTVYTGPSNPRNWPFPGGGNGGGGNNGGNYPGPRRPNRPKINIPGIPWPNWPLAPTGSPVRSTRNSAGATTAASSFRLLERAAWATAGSWRRSPRIAAARCFTPIRSATSEAC